MHAPIKNKLLQLPFMNSKYRKSIKKKSMAQHKWSTSGGILNWNKYKHDRNKSSHIRRASIKGYFHEKCNKDSPQSKSFGKTINPFLSKDSFHSGGECIILQDNGIFIHNEQEVCNMFNRYFGKHNDKVFSNDRDVDAYNLCLQCIEAKWKHSNQTFEFKKVNVATVI